MKTHLQTVHSSNKPFCCDFEDCTFACKTKASLERHIRRHTGKKIILKIIPLSKPLFPLGERPFVCESCGRSFRESGTLARHIKSRVPCTRKADRKPNNNYCFGSADYARKKIVRQLGKTAPQALKILLPVDKELSLKPLVLQGSKSTDVLLECNGTALFFM